MVTDPTIGEAVVHLSLYADWLEYNDASGQDAVRLAAVRVLLKSLADDKAKIARLERFEDELAIVRDLPVIPDNGKGDGGPLATLRWLRGRAIAAFVERQEKADG